MNKISPPDLVQWFKTYWLRAFAILGNLIFSVVYLSLIATFGQRVPNVDVIDLVFEGASAFIALFMFVVICVIRVEKLIRIHLLIGLLLIQVGRATDCLDEVFLFNWLHWSAVGDGMTLVGELFAVVAATYWLLRTYRLSVTDKLTSLYNRYHLERVFEKAVRFKRFSDKQVMVLIMLDVDNFKRINDCYGHQVGDEVLKVMAQLLIKNTRQGDVVARQGGEEFEILLLQTELSEAVGIAERIRFSFEHYQSTHLPAFTASIGVARYVQGDDIKSLRRRADNAVYEAKKQGKNRIVVGDVCSKSEELVQEILKQSSLEL